MSDEPQEVITSSDEAEAKLVRQLEPLVRPGKAEEVKHLLEVTFSRFHSGPLPPPDHLVAYEDAHPGTAERIVAMAEREQAHRHKQESKAVTAEYGMRLLGQMSAMVTIFILAVLAGFCAYIKQPIAAGVVGAIGGAAAYFLNRTQKEQAGAPKPPAKRKRK